MEVVDGKDVGSMKRTALAGIMAAFKLRGSFSDDIRGTLMELKEEFDVNDDQYLTEFRRICHDEDVDRHANNVLGARLSWLHESQIIALKLQKRRKKQSRVYTKKYCDNMLSTRSRRASGSVNIGAGPSSEVSMRRSSAGGSISTGFSSQAINFAGPSQSSSEFIAPQEFFNLTSTSTVSSSRSKRKRRLSAQEELKKRKEKLHLQSSLRAYTFKQPPRPTAPLPFTDEAVKRFAESLSRAESRSQNVEEGDDEFEDSSFNGPNLAAIEADADGNGVAVVDDGDGLVRLASALRNAEDLRKGWAVEAIANRLFRERFTPGIFPFFSTPTSSATVTAMPPLSPIAMPMPRFHGRRMFPRRRRNKRSSRREEEQAEEERGEAGGNENGEDEEEEEDDDDSDIDDSETPQNMEHVAEDLTFAAFPGLVAEPVEENVVEDHALTFGRKSPFTASAVPMDQASAENEAATASSSTPVYYNLDPANIGFLLHTAAAANYAFGMGVDALLDASRSVASTTSSLAALDLSTSGTAPVDGQSEHDGLCCQRQQGCIEGANAFSPVGFLPAFTLPVPFPVASSPEVAVRTSE